MRPGGYSAGGILVIGATILAPQATLPNLARQLAPTLMSL